MLISPHTSSPPQSRIRHHQHIYILGCEYCRNSSASPRVQVVDLRCELLRGTAAERTTAGSLCPPPGSHPRMFGERSRCALVAQTAGNLNKIMSISTTCFWLRWEQLLEKLLEELSGGSMVLLNRYLSHSHGQFPLQSSGSAFHAAPSP